MCSCTVSFAITSLISSLVSLFFFAFPMCNRLVSLSLISLSLISVQTYSSFFSLWFRYSDMLLLISTDLFIVLVHDMWTGKLFSHLPLPDSIKQFMFMLWPARCRSALSATNFISPLSYNAGDYTWEVQLYSKNKLKWLLWTGTTQLSFLLHIQPLQHFMLTPALSSTASLLRGDLPLCNLHRSNAPILSNCLTAGPSRYPALCYLHMRKGSVLWVKQ